MNRAYHNISIIIPAFNEEDGISKVIDGINEVMARNDITYEIIVIDDGSTDGTGKVVRDRRDISVIQHPQNKGYGASLKTGIRNAINDTIVIIDADGTYPNEEILNLLEYIPEYDMVVGARTGEDVSISFLRKAVKWFLNRLANYLSESKIPDLNSGLRVMKKDIINKFIKILPNGFSFTTTITLALLTNDYQIKYIPINYRKRKGKSKIRPIHDTFTFIQLISRTVLYFNPLKVFLPLAFLFFIPGIGFLVRDILALNIAQTSVLLIITSGLILSIGMLADLIDKRL